MTWRKNKINVNAVFFTAYFSWILANVNFAPWKERRGTWKKIFPLKWYLHKNGISIFFGSFWAGKKCFPLTLDVILVSEHTICASLSAHHRVIRNILDASFTFMKNLPGKMLLPSGAILHGLASIFVDSPIFSRDYNSSLWYS